MEEEFAKIEIDCNSIADIMTIRPAFESNFAAEAFISGSLLRKTKFLATIQHNKTDVVGIGGIYTNHYFFSDLYLAVDDKFRGKGIGNYLLDAVLSFVDAKKITLFIQTYDCEDYTHAISLYKKHDFVVYSKYQTKILMAKRDTKKCTILLRKSLFQLEGKIRSFKRGWSE